MKVLLVVLAVLLVLFVLFVLSLKPHARRAGFRFEHALIAHRGLYGNGIPENSLSAFRSAFRKGGIGAELDVQMTKDKQLVVFHDWDLKRMCGIDGSLSDFTYEELHALSLQDTKEKIPLFADALRALGGIPLVCEIKTRQRDGYQELCEAAAELFKTYKGSFCVESFHPGVVKWFRDNHPEIIRGHLSMRHGKDSEGTPCYQRFAVTHLMLNFLTRPDFIAYRYTDSKMLGFRLCRSLYHPHTVGWTARGAAAIADARKRGFEAVIFEEPGQTS